jgi:REP-associated tyrosine transposase
MPTRSLGMFDERIIELKTEIGYRKKVKHLDLPGQAHYLTFSCFKTQPFLSKDRSRFWVIDALKNARTKHGYELWAWVIMPEHVHLLVLPRNDVTISKILNSIKLSVGKTASIWVQNHAPDFLSKMTDIQPSGKSALRFWQRGGGYDRNICSVDEVYEKIHYIHKNPVRRGLVNHPEDWIWSSYRAYEKGIEEPISIDKDSLPPYK